MTSVLMLALLLSSPSSSPTDVFTVQANLQAIYDEADQTALQFDSPTEVDLYHSVRCTSDWTFVDAQGATHPWSEMRTKVIATIEDRDDWMTDGIRKIVSVKPDATVVLVDETIVKKTTSQVTSYRDTWVHDGDSWKLQTRTQVGAPRTIPYEPEKY